MIFFFFPKKGKCFSLACRAVEVQTAHFSFSEVWKWNIHDYRELSWSVCERERDEDGDENCCYFDTCFHLNFHGVHALFQDRCSPLAPVGSFNQKNRQWKIAHRFPPTVSNCPFFFYLSLVPLFSLSLCCSTACCHFSTVGDISVVAGKKALAPTQLTNWRWMKCKKKSSEFMELLHHGVMLHGGL